jgi:hypothetical protein
LSCSCCVCMCIKMRALKNFLKRITWVKWHGKDFRVNQIKEKLSCTCICSYTPLHCFFLAYIQLIWLIELPSKLLSFVKFVLISLSLLSLSHLINHCSKDV